MRICGLYTIKNKVNQKIYVGSSNNINKRWVMHKIALRKGCHANHHLQSSWSKYGEESFEFSILIECSEVELLLKESEAIKKYKDENPSILYNQDCPSNLSYIRRPPKGESHYNAKLKRKQVHFIRANIIRLSLHPNIIAEALSISTSTMMDILKNRSWEDSDYEASLIFYRNTEYLRELQNKYTGMSASHRKLDLEKVKNIRERHRNGDKTKDIANSYQLNIKTIRNVLNGKTWKDRVDLCPPQDTLICL